MFSQVNDNPRPGAQPIVRIRIWYAVLLVVLAIFLIRLFYIQIIRYDYYKDSALSDQLKQYEIPASRGRILVQNGTTGQTLPIVLNQKLYVLYADPVFIKDADRTARAVAGITGGDTAAYKQLMSRKDSRYAILAKKVTEDQKKKITALKSPGIGTQVQEYRTYPQGLLAAQVLGFVNDEGKGTYGVEQALDSRLKGQKGELKAITDVHGVPLAASSGNTLKPAVPGKDITLTLDLPMQKQLEMILADGVTRTRAESAHAVIMDPRTGAVKAMANVPTYDPAKYYEVEDGARFNNGAVTHSIEVGSIMKTLTTAAALDTGVIKPTTTYYDPAKWKIDEFNITNIEEDGGPGVRSVADILNLSLNTGVTWELMQMGGGTINQKARTTWHNYMVNHFLFGKTTGIEQGYESPGFVPGPKDNGAGINLTYANTAFGQAMTATPIQMAAAMSAVVNGGTYYQPHLIESAPKVVRQNVVSGKVSKEIIPLLQYVIDKHNVTPAFDQSRYIVGGKTGTAQIEKDGKYLDNDFNGTYLGFVGGDQPEYVIAVFMNKPKITGYAGSAAAQPVFVKLGHMLINNSYVTAKN
ncbi:MAG TPA: penicillin-binding protein 2 [Candidatus Saccharimonadales bacterium]|jgi:cell division protein FtsI/penicillin-binding protein 2